MTNSIADKKITEALEKHKQSLDDIQQHFWDTLILNRLTNGEVAALFTSLMRRMLMTSVNVKLLEELGIDSGKLTPEIVTIIQQQLTINYLNQADFLNESDDTTTP